MPSHRRRLGRVGGDARDAAVQGDVLRLRVGQHERAGRCGLNDLAAQQTLRVVAQDHRVAFRRTLAHELRHAVPIRVREHRRRLPIRSHDLLVVRDDARLARGRPIEDREDPGVVDILRTQQLAHLRGKRVVTDRTGECDARAQRAQVVGHVAGAAEREGMVDHGDDRNGCLGRDARDRSPDPFVDHQVADDHDPKAVRAVEERPRVGHHQRGRHGIPPSKISCCSTRSQTMCAITWCTS